MRGFVEREDERARLAEKRLSEAPPRKCVHECRGSTGGFETRPLKVVLRSVIVAPFVAIAAETRGAAPKVGAGDVIECEAERVVPRVIVRAEVGERVPGECVNWMRVGARGFVGRSRRDVDVAQ